MPLVYEVAAGLGQHSLWRPLAVSILFALLARRLRGVTASGAVAGATICFLFYAGAGRGAFAVLVVLFMLTSLATRVGYIKKQSLGTAESREGRTASQVLANLGTAALCVVFFCARGTNTLLVAFVAAISEAAADTVSSEIGQSRRQTARLITTWRIVPAGTDGGISSWGTFSGFAAAVLITTTSAAVGLVPWGRIGIPIAAAVAGMMADSLLGASLERRGWLNNDAVNFLGTCVAVAVAYVLG